MPALTHNRVKNGFNGGIRKRNATAGTKFSRTLGASKADATRSKALVGDIGSIPPHIRAAYNRRVRCKCRKKIDTLNPIIVALVQITTPTTNVTPSFDFSSNEVGIITSNYIFTSTKNAVIGSNTIIFSNLASGTYSDVFVQVTDKAGNVSNKLVLNSFVISDTVPPTLVAKTQITTPANNNTPSFVFTSDEAGTITSSIGITSTPNAIVGDNTITFAPLSDGTYSGVTVSITDVAGNGSNVLTLSDFTIETVSPVLTAKTQITTPGTDNTPSFVFTSDEAGTITTSHPLLSGTTTSAISGDNTITFDTLLDGTYSGVWVKVTDAVGNVSNQLTLDDFVVDTLVPTLNAVTQITTPGNNNTPSFVFTSTKAGTITSSKTFTSTTTAVVGNNTITFDTLADNTYSGVTVEVTDSLGNVSNLLTLSDFVIDTAAPTIAAKTQISTPTTDNTPSFVFTSDEAGTITSSHTFTSTTYAISGDNTITFDTLADGTYNTVWVKVTDAAGNESSQLTLDSFVVNDTVAPTIAAVTPITTPTTDNTPSFVFISDEAGTITSSNTFTSTTNAIVGNNTITFDTLVDGTYNTVWVKVTDVEGNVSNQLTLDPFTVDTNTDCLTLNTTVNVVSSGGNKYVFNGGSTYDSSKKYGLNNATYTFKDIPIGHPLAILNNGNADITYAAVANTASPIKIKVSGGNQTESNGDYYDFKDEDDNTINIGSDDTSTFRFMRGKTYIFEADGIGTSHPFKIYMSSAFVNDNNSSNSGISGSSGSITITIPTNHSTSAGDLYYQCSNHSGMKKNLSLFYKSVSGTTNDASYDFFYDDVAVTVSGDFGDVSVYCYHHGYMGGESLLKYKSSCSP